MGYQRRDEWERDTEVYSPAQVEAVANYCGIEIVGETNTHLQGYCPFHHNTDSPAFVIDKTKGLWTCFNPSCGNSGNLEKLLRSLKGLNYFEATRIILKYKNHKAESVAARLAAIREETPEFVAFPSEPVTRMINDLWEHDRPRQYLHSRGLNDDTIRYFGVGYSVKRDMTIVPMHDPTGTILVGFIGR